MKIKRLWIILFSIAILLLLPLIAMQFTSEVVWTSIDFITMGILLLFTGLMIEVILRSVKIIQQRFIFISFIAALFLLVWLELAVGILGTPFAGS